MITETLSRSSSDDATSSPDTLSAKPDIFPTSVESVRQGGEDTFRHHQITVHNADCMEVMATFPDGHFDLAIVDPPYGIGIVSDRNPTWAKWKGKEWDNEPPSHEYFAELRRVSKHQIIWGGNYFLDHLTATRCFLSWDKMNGTNSMADFELAWTSFEESCRRFAMHHFSAGYDTKIHPTQKPVALYRWILANYAKPGWKILDTHGGSLSSAIACHYAGNPLVVCELDPDYFKAACARLVRETAQAELPIITQPQHEQAELI